MGMILGIFLSCSDSLKDFRNSDRVTSYIDFDEWEDDYETNSLARSGYCCNNGMPSAARPDTLTTRLKLCDGDPGEESLTGKECAIVWSQYNLEMNQNLGYQACGKNLELSPRKPDWISGSTISGNPYLEWGFVYNHYYRIERKIGNGSWSLLASLDNIVEDFLTPGDSSYTDLSVTTGSMNFNHYYRVKSDIFDSFSSSTEVIEYEVPINVTISGPTSITTLQKGTFTTTVGGGLPGYTYEWWKFQDCDEIFKEPGTKAPPCGSWVKLSGTSSSILLVESDHLLD